MSKRLFENRKGISNLIATLILIAVAVVGGAFAYTAFRNQAQSTTTSADLQVQDLTLQKVGSATYSSVTVKNVGTQRLTDIKVTIAPPQDTTNATPPDIQLAPQDLDPGQTGSASKDSADKGTFNAGETYAVQITASTPNGSITKTTTVRVQS